MLSSSLVQHSSVSALNRHSRIGKLNLRDERSPLINRRPVSCLAASSDPYSVLGIGPDADNNEINRAYSKKKYEYRHDTANLQKVEQAHSSLMLSALSRRVKAGGAVPKDIKYADVEPLFPWRPKRWDATPQVIMIVGAIQLFLSISSFQSPNMSKLIGSMLIGIAGNVVKQNAISPPPKDPDLATEEEAGRAGRNFVRGGLLGLLATFAGMVVFTAPESLAQALNFKLPGILATQPGLLISMKVAGVALSNWIMTSFYY
ncbi:hypothetical protein CEUSTIGMA_g13727.t1 [Chlamydomonas eustigma]|uniref:Uncharacterized protein n=1 Tax=Chlamydomonas eustigma TaxID=1157962 RepID=A0A250XTC8_9CHLO|nr:hypothetical protein CEUSTIGMA_g13727.t1 [Chlamydomonas eustigma]|eukprot:GAX86315.1 hypothetical protein CEUSTIGMA_g13727.t1 [Chlamydomonas eustigma]